MYPNCSTSCDIPLGLVVYENGREPWFRRIGLAIFWRMFADEGRRVGFDRATVHSSCGTHDELRDIRTERLIERVLGCPTTFQPVRPRSLFGSLRGFSG